MPTRPEDRAGRFRISLKTAERIAEVWPAAISLSNAMHRAGLKVTDKRNMNRYRRDAEALLNIKLPPHNPEFSTETEIRCPSFLDVKKAKQAKAFVITSAVNNTNLNDRFFDTLELFAEKNAAQMICLPIKYKHNMLMGGQDYKWPERIHNYALLDDLIISKSLVISSLNIQATAANPLSGLSPNSGTRSAVYGSPQVALEPVPTPGDKRPKYMFTTGACTSATYTKTKAGGRAKFHHSFSALFVKLVGNEYHTIHLHWDGKGFYYLDEYWTPDGVTSGHRSELLFRADDHEVLRDNKLLSVRDNLIKRTKPKRQAFNDILDFRYQNHHNNRFDKVRLAQSGQWLVEKEMERLVPFLEGQDKDSELWIVGSNHDDAADRWLNRFCPDKDPHNALFAWELSAAVLKSGKPALETFLKPRISRTVKFLDRNKEALVKGVDVSQHGDVGANGARGSANTFAKFSRKTIIGHSHSVRIRLGCYQVGVSTKNMDYAKGYSSWDFADCLIYPNGKRAMIFYVNYKHIGEV